MSGILLSSSGGAASVNKYKVLYSKDVGKKRMVYNDGFLSVSRKTQGNQQSVTAILTDEDGKELRRLSHHNGQGLNYAVGEEVAMMQFSVQIEESLDAADASVPAVQQAPLPPLPTEKKTPFTLPTFSSSSMLKSSLPKSSVDLLSRSNKVVAPRTGFKPPSLTPSNTSSTIPSHSNETFIGVNVVESSSFKDIFVKNEELEVEHDVKICSETLKDHKENYLNHEPILQESTFKPSMSYVGIGYATLTAKNNKFICPSGSVGGVRGGPEKVNLSEITLNPSISKVMKEHQIVGANFLLDKVIRKPVIVSKVLDSLKESDDENSSDLDDGLYDTDEEEEQRRKYKRQRVHQADHNKTKEDVENQSQSVRGCILADEMGLGKTLTTLSVLYTLMQHDVCKSIIVTPSSLVDNWANETKKWLHTKMEPLVIKAGTDANAVINVFSISRTSRYPILIISYELFRKHVDLINSTVRGMDMIVCDEGHRLKNIDGTKTIEALKRCKAKMRIVLTGTPIQNDIEELYSLVSFVAPNLLGNLQHFKRLYSDHICSVESTGKDGGGNDEKAALVNLLGSIILRRTQQEVLSKLLPPRTDYIIKCKLSPTQSILYDRVVEEAKRALEGGDNVVDEIDIYQSQPESVSSCILPTLQNLRKLCVVPSADIQKHLRVKSSSSAPTSSKLLVRRRLLLFNLFTVSTLFLFFINRLLKHSLQKSENSILLTRLCWFLHKSQC